MALDADGPALVVVDLHADSGCRVRGNGTSNLPRTLESEDAVSGLDELDRLLRPVRHHDRGAYFDAELLAVVLVGVGIPVEVPETKTGPGGPAPGVLAGGIGSAGGCEDLLGPVDDLVHLLVRLAEEDAAGLASPAHGVLQPVAEESPGLSPASSSAEEDVW